MLTFPHVLWFTLLFLGYQTIAPKHNVIVKTTEKKQRQNENKGNTRHMKLSQRLLLYFVLCSAFFTLFSTALQLYLDLQRDTKNLNEEIQFVEKSYVPALERSVYNLDKKQIILQLEGLLQLKDIVYAEVIDYFNDNNAFRVSAGAITKNSNTSTFPLIFRNEFTGQNQNAGQLIIQSNMTAIYERLQT